MESIANVTLGQIGTWINHHWIQITVWLIAFDNILITACAGCGWTKAETKLTQVSKFLVAILAARYKMIIPPADNAKAVPVSAAEAKNLGQSNFDFLLLVMSVCLIVGCMSVGSAKLSGTGINTIYGQANSINSEISNLEVGVPLNAIGR